MAASGLRVAGHLGIAAYLGLISLLAQISAEPLLLFPELGALTAVVVLNPASPWTRSAPLLVLTPALTAAAGLLISRHLSYGPASVLAVVAISLALIGLLRSPVMPALSAGLLPLTLGLQSWSYPLAVLPGLLGLALLVLWRRRDVPPPVREPLYPPWRRWLPALLLFLVGALVWVQLLGSRLVLYPPLLVLAFETLAHGDRTPWRQRPVALLVLITGAAGLGLLLAKTVLSGVVAVLLAVVLTSLLSVCMHLICPPAYAVALLPLVIPAPGFGYPLHVLAGTVWLVLISHVSSRRARELTQ